MTKYVKTQELTNPIWNELKIVSDCLLTGQINGRAHPATIRHQVALLLDCLLKEEDLVDDGGGQWFTSLPQRQEGLLKFF